MLSRPLIKNNNHAIEFQIDTPWWVICSLANKTICLNHEANRSSEQYRLIEHRVEIF